MAIAPPGRTGRMTLRLPAICPLPFVLERSACGRQSTQTVTFGSVWHTHAMPVGVDATHSHKDVGIQLHLRELPKGGWVVDVTLRRPDSETGTKYEVKTIHATRIEAEISGLAVARRIIDTEH
jgi:hypothetical protein